MWSPFHINRGILGESTEGGKIEEIADVEQLPMKGQKKSPARRLASSFLQSPAQPRLECLSEQQHAQRPVFLGIA
ncbi:hypothetical protein [Pseudomonas sp. MN1F]|uniref:hypothetical protein n=1 Tax=Pseudomonas sp. MN1F TaxID=1366632 RepID=UPI00128EDB5D|nr:hypothetical protein [Pseudomonas sp. MN1F]MQG95128.1 hypothetical protein [Pseudomonas sp. MN1F]